MQSTYFTKSDKLNIIDHSTFAQIQENSNLPLSRTARKVRNAKYRKTHQREKNNLDLMALIAASNLKKTYKPQAHHKKGATLLNQGRIIRKGGKTREHQQKKLTRLKKSILRNRELKHKAPDDQLMLLESKNYDRNLQVTESGSSHQEVFKTEDGMHTLHSNLASNSNLQESISVSPIESRLPCKIFKMTHEMCELTLQDSSSKMIKSIHSRRFREYCDNCTTSDLAKLSTELLSDLNRFQKRAYMKNPIKANAHRRIVLGFREVLNNLRVNKVKLVLIATDCEKCLSKGGIDDTIETIKNECKSLNVPYAFPLQRRQLAYALKKNGNISIVGILDYDGAQDKFTQLLQSLENARAKYNAST